MKNIEQKIDAADQIIDLLMEIKGLHRRIETSTESAEEYRMWSEKLSNRCLRRVQSMKSLIAVKMIRIEKLKIKI